MQQQTVEFRYDIYGSIDELDVSDAQLLREAIHATRLSYAPYSRFHVGAAARLRNGEIVTGANQENAAFPAGICAERVVLATLSSTFPQEPIEVLAVSYHNEQGPSDHPISPCGICRQSLSEYEQLTRHAMRLILGGEHGEVYVVRDASGLLPLGFSSSDM